jgi:hypothetical protein
MNTAIIYQLLCEKYNLFSHDLIRVIHLRFKVIRTWYLAMNNAMFLIKIVQDIEEVFKCQKAPLLKSKKC